MGLAPSFLLSCFVSGLTLEIRREVQALQPISLLQAIALAKLQEDKLEDRRQGYRGKPTTSATSPTPALTTPPLSSPLLPTPPKLQFKKLNPDEMAARREKGLCYNCDDKWGPNHKCKERYFVFVAEDEEDHLDPDPPPLLLIRPPPIPPQTKPTAKSV